MKFFIHFTLLIFVSLLSTHCKGHDNTLEHKISINNILWEAYSILENKDTIIYASCNFSNIKVKVNDENNSIWIQYPMEDVEYKITKIDATKENEIIYFIDNDSIISKYLDANSVAWTLPDFGTFICTSKPEKYKLIKEPGIYCWDLDEIKDRSTDEGEQYLLQETNIKNIDDFIEIKYNKQYFDIQNRLIEDITGDGINDEVIVISKKDHEEYTPFDFYLLLIFVGNKDHTYQVAVENWKIITSLTTNIGVGFGEISYETQLNEEEKIHYKYVYEKEKEDWILNVIEVLNLDLGTIEKQNTPYRTLKTIK